MRHWIYATAASVSLALLGAVGQANALPVDRFTPTAIPSEVEQAQFFYGGRDYCWYDDGWRGPGFYWCGYAWRRGLGWGGGVWMAWLARRTRPRWNWPPRTSGGRPPGRAARHGQAPRRRPAGGGHPGGGRPGGGGGGHGHGHR